MKLSFFAAFTLAAVAQAASIPDLTTGPEMQLIVLEHGLVPTNETHIAKRTGPEVTHCFNTGTAETREKILPIIHAFCGHNFGTVVNNGMTIYARYISTEGKKTVLVSGSAINGCNFKIDNNCERLLRMPLDNCNTNTVTAKQGGYETDSCGQWRLDPGSNGSDF